MAPLPETIVDLIASLHPTPRAWLLNSALAPHLDAFGAHLRRGRYAAGTIKDYVTGIAHFAHWMTQCDLSVQMLDLAMKDRAPDSLLAFLKTL